MADFSVLGLGNTRCQLGMQAHFDAMSQGRLDSRDVLYFISWMVLSVLVARFVLAMRRGRLVREGTSLVLSTAILGVVMVLGQLVHGALDLTLEKRHTLADGTRQLLEGLQDDVLITCYLTGELPREWRRLEGEMESLLQRMSRASDGKLTYQFVDIYAVDDPQTVGKTSKPFTSGASVHTHRV